MLAHGQNKGVLIKYFDIGGKVMRLRSIHALSILLFLALIACSTKPADTPASSSTGPAAASDTAGGNLNSTGATPKSGGKVEAQSSTVNLPEGTTITVRLGESLGSKLSTPGQSFTATVAEPVTINGNTVIASGTDARGTVVDAKPLGKFKGGAVLQVQLTSITLNGAEHPIQTSAISRSLKGKGKRTAVIAGGGTAVGALIGGLAGGGKGAAIGAIAGAGAGGAGAAFTGNKDIVLPAESALTFKLTAPVELKPAK